MFVENKKVYLLEEHLSRLRETSKYFLFISDEKKVLRQLKKIISNPNNLKYKLRITLNKWGRMNLYLINI